MRIFKLKIFEGKKYSLFLRLLKYNNGHIIINIFRKEKKKQQYNFFFKLYK
jgi:hypothetical protein